MIFYNGGTGSLGRYFSEALLRKTVKGMHLQTRLENWQSLHEELEEQEGNFTGSEVALVQMAAMVPVTECEKAPDRAFRTNVTDTAHYVEAFIKWAQANRLVPSVLYVSTGHVYKEQTGELNLNEDHPVEPRSVYARSKLLAEYALQELTGSSGVDLVIARVFGLIAPIQPPHYVLPGIIRRVLTEELGAIPGLSCVRDYLDARDVCENLITVGLLRASRELSTHPIVNICSGRGLTIRSLLEQVIKTLRPKDEARLLQKIVEAPKRADEILRIVGNPNYFRQLTGLEPQRISTFQTIREAACASG